MNDKQIRKILVEYLKASQSKIRIFQEKSIGSSICDVMTVTDCLTGYEIKSDADNYSRFESQRNAYDRFFDKNYIVVGESHVKSVEHKVPAHWGIVCIKSGNVEIVRKARKNQGVSRRSQLTVLWKLELKNLLIKNSMPLFAQKDKGYISDRIAESVESETLGLQIAEELFNRDYSTYQAEDYTVKQEEQVFTNLPEFEIVDSLSEENLAEYTLDQWIALYHKAQIIREKKNFDYDSRLVKRTEHVIRYTEITPTLGAPWISEAIINDFIVHLYGDGKYKRSYRKPRAKREAITGCWNVSEKKAHLTLMNTNITNVFGTNRYNALQILESTLNLREIKIHDGTIFNQKETVAALEKQKLIIEEFNDWIWKSEDRIWEIEECYNKLFGGFEKRTYDGSKLVFPEMNSSFELYDYQKDAVQKIITTNNTLLAFDVGAGKTYIMIAAAMKLREMGISRKNLFVVPNNIVGQWEKIFTDLYPKAKVLTIEPKSFKWNMRTKVLEQMRDGDYDGIIIAYSCFEMIPLSVDYVNTELNGKLRVIEKALNEMRGQWHLWGASVLEREKAYVKKTACDLIDSLNYEYQGITFDDLEINTLFLDEAHNYKNIPIKTALKNLNGINTKGSLKCLDMQKKIKCVQDNNGGRGAVLATGTPLCNSISDAYAMQLYLQPEEMQKRELDQFDNWVKTFAMPEQLCEIDVDTSKFRMVRRFAKFFNLPELSKMFSQVAIFHAVEPKDLPDFKGYDDIIIKKNPPLTDYMKSLSERADLIRDKAVEKYVDNMLKVSTDGRKAALDLNLVGCEQAYDEFSKVYRCARQVFAVYKTDAACSQLIFCDYSTPKNDTFDVYNKLKELLISFGVKEKEIAFIHSYTTESRKLKLYEMVNKAEIKILIGSTFKLGIGANVQTRLKAVHHLDAPWRPADMVQREGRILRRGNENEEVNIYRYIAEGSFDAYSWQILETKQRFITQFLTGSSYQRSAYDLEENVLTYAEVKALALAEPLMKIKAEKENEIKTLKLLYVKEQEENKRLADEKNELDSVLTELGVELARKSIIANNIKRFMNAEKLKQEIKTLSTALTKEFLFTQKGETGFNVYCFQLELPENQDEKKPYILLREKDSGYKRVCETVYMGQTPTGNATRVFNYIKNYDKQVELLKDRITNAGKRKEDIETLLSQSSTLHNQIEVAEKELDAINVGIQMPAIPDFKVS